VEDNLGVMSIGFMLPDPDEAVIWRGPRKNGLIKQFLRDVHWGGRQERPAAAAARCSGGWGAAAAAWGS
jgi:hypothetical protein